MRVVLFLLIILVFTEAMLPYSTKNKIYEICNSSSLQNDPERSWDVVPIGRIATIDEFIIHADSAHWFLWARTSNAGFNSCCKITVPGLDKFAVLNITSFNETVSFYVKSPLQHVVNFFDKNLPNETYSVLIDDQSAIYFYEADVLVFRSLGNLVQRAWITMQTLKEFDPVVYHNFTEPMELLNKIKISNGTLYIDSKHKNCSVPSSEVTNSYVGLHKPVIIPNCTLKNVGKSNPDITTIIFIIVITIIAFCLFCALYYELSECSKSHPSGAENVFYDNIGAIIMEHHEVALHNDDQRS
uniref:Uncharacterized protein n=1 Tax=Panagrolaimus sp. JU765 TaxID=591449 RepID=A0AC34QI80_9BILA